MNTITSIKEKFMKEQQEAVSQEQQQQLAFVAQLIDLMRSKECNQLKVGDIEIALDFIRPIEPIGAAIEESKQKTPEEIQQEEDELLFYSAGE